MAETKLPVQTVQVDYTCDECGKGQMRFGGVTLTSYPPQYPHRCSECGAKKTFNVIYPHTAVEPITYTINTRGAVISEKELMKKIKEEMSRANRNAALMSRS